MSIDKNEWLNKKYEPLPGEFVYKNVPHCIWSTREFIERVENDVVFFPDDILVATYPKSGTTLIEEMIWLINNQVDIEQAKKYNLICRFPFIEENYEHSYPNLNFTGYIINFLDKIERPRFLKTHLCFKNLESKILANPEMKVVTCFRNPKDTAVSMYHFYIGIADFGPYKGSWDDFFERWIDGWIAGGDWLDVVTEWWTQRHRKNVKILFYEDILSNKAKVTKDLCEFFGKSLTDEEIGKIVHHTEFKNMKENPSTNYKDVEGFEEGFVFMRKGKVGDWKNYFSDDQNKRLEEKYGPVLEKCGLSFKYE